MTENVLTVDDLKARLILSNRVSFTLTPLEEHVTLESQLISREPEYLELEQKEIKSIKAGLAQGNIWRWCCVRLRADFAGLTGTDYLGGCSYKNEKDFIKSSGYYQDMQDTALTEIATQIRDSLNQLGLLPHIRL